MGRKTAQAGNYAAPVDDEGMDPAMRETLGLTVKGRERRPQTATSSAPAGNVGTPGNRPLTTAKNLPAMQQEIERMKGVNEGARIMKRREGALRNPRNS